jgi:hypothetical protein
MNGNLVELLTERDVAKILNISVATIRRRRLFGKPPEWVKIGSSVRYLPEAVAKLIEDGRLHGNPDPYGSEPLEVANPSAKRRSCK